MSRRRDPSGKAGVSMRGVKTRGLTRERCRKGSYTGEVKKGKMWSEEQRKMNEGRKRDEDWRKNVRG